MNSYEIIITAILYIVSMISFAHYLYFKHKKERYILSITNASLFIYAVSLYIIPLFTFTPVAWVKLLGDAAYTRAPMFYPYLLKCLKINCFGFIFFNVFIVCFEQSKKKPQRIIRSANRSEKYLIEKLLSIEFLGVFVVWLMYCIFVVRGFGLFGESSTSENGMLHYVNQACQILLTVMTLYYGFNYLNKRKNLFFFLMGLSACILMGKRSTLIGDIIWTLAVYWLYKRVKSSRKVFFRAAKYAVVLVAAGLLVGNVRSSGSEFTLVQNLIYGNTFCDIRDGGYILYGFQNNTGSEWALGKTYLSALISFIPSSLSLFRLHWDFGRYSTTTLFGMTNHPGLRGGWSMEGYLNFGWIGVIVVSILSAKVLSSLEKYFREEMFSKNLRTIDEKAIIPIYFYLIAAKRITCSSGFFSLYVLFLFSAINIAIGRLIKGNEGRRLDSMRNAP